MPTSWPPQNDLGSPYVIIKTLTITIATSYTFIPKPNV